MPEESGGPIPDQGLIALGSANSLDGAVELTEYGYIYEKRFSTMALRETNFDLMAKQTFLGVEDFFGVGQSTVTASIANQGL